MSAYMFRAIVKVFRVKGVGLVLGCLLFTSVTTVNCSIAKTSMPRLEHAYTSIQDEKVLAKHLAVAYFAGGCFWGMQNEFNKISGVESTIVGYCGGKTNSPTYEKVCQHNTGHAETVRVIYDPKKVGFKTLVSDFLEMHDPTTMNRQGPDIGDQYRSEIFYTDDSQKTDSAAVIADKQKSLGENSHIVTALEKFKVFYTAEDYHQNYIAKTGTASCHRVPK